MAKINWSRVTVEGVVIVGSILLALGLEAAWSDRESRRIAYRELGNVLEEFQESRGQIDTLGAWHSRIHTGSTAFALLLRSVPDGAEVLVPDSMIGHLLAAAVTDAPTSVLDAFVAAGRLEEIDNEDLRRQLLTWGSVLADLRDDEFRIRGYMDSDVLPYVRTQADITRALDLVQPMWFGRLDPTMSGETAITSTMSLKNLATYQALSYGLLSIQAESALALVDDLIVTVQRELDSSG